MHNIWYLTDMSTLPLWKVILWIFWIDDIFWWHSSRINPNHLIDIIQFIWLQSILFHQKRIQEICSHFVACHYIVNHILWSGNTKFSTSHFISSKWTDSIVIVIIPVALIHAQAMPLLTLTNTHSATNKLTHLKHTKIESMRLIYAYLVSMTLPIFQCIC